MKSVCAPLALCFVSFAAACGGTADVDGEEDAGADGATGGSENKGGEGSGGEQEPSGGAPHSGGQPDTGSGGAYEPGPCPSQVVSPEFTLLWEDEFDSLDEGNGARWTIMEHTFHENLAQFSRDAVRAEDGYLKLFLTQQQTGEKEYRGGEIRTNESFQYGRFDTCVRWGKGGGVIGSFFTYLYEPWNEIDIEYLGGNPVGIQYNIIYNPSGEGNVYDPFFDDLGGDPADDFHQYSMEWTPGQIRFYVDGILRHTENEASAAAITEASTLRMNLWASWTDFAGTFDPGAIPTESWYDWVRVYSYTP